MLNNACLSCVAGLACITNTAYVYVFKNGTTQIWKSAPGSLLIGEAPEDCPTVLYVKENGIMGIHNRIADRLRERRLSRDE